MYIFVTRAAPNRESLAKTNGLSQVSSTSLIFPDLFFLHMGMQIVNSLCGALGPTLATILFAISKEYDLLGGQLIYVVMVVFSVAGVFLSSLLPPREETPRSTAD